MIFFHQIPIKLHITCIVGCIKSITENIDFDLKFTLVNMKIYGPVTPGLRPLRSPRFQNRGDRSGCRWNIFFCGHTYIIDCTGCLHKYLIHSHWLHRDLTAISATTLQLWRFLCLAISLRPLRPYYDHCEFSATARRSFLLHFGRRGFLSMSKTLGDHSAISAIIAILLRPYCDLTLTSRRPWRFWRLQPSQS